jgi:hypothetical protein
MRGYVHLRATNSRCHRNSVAGVTKNAAHRCRGSSFANAASTIRSVRGVPRTRYLPAQHRHLVAQH